MFKNLRGETEMSAAKRFGWTGFLTGFALGSVVSILLTTRSGRELTGLKNDFSDVLNKGEEIKNLLLRKAKDLTSDFLDRGRIFIESCKKFSNGKYAGTIESLENEYYDIKHAINSAIDNYKRNPDRKYSEDDLFIDFEDEKLPKFVGMSRRKRS